MAGKVADRGSLIGSRPHHSGKATRQESTGNARVDPRSEEGPSLETLYGTLFAPLVRRATWRHRLSKSDATDVVQEAFLLALQKDFPEAHAGAWLTRVVDYLAINFKRKAARRGRLLREHAGDAGTTGATNRASDDRDFREEGS
jgi:DNA-directed RNA polymerase specialized sigma24 family protein